MIEPALGKWLADHRDGTTTNTVRQTARKNLRNLLKRGIYIGRRPPRTRLPALVIRRLATTPSYLLDGEETTQEVILDLTLYAKTPHEVLADDGLAEELRVSMTGYVGLWDTVTVHACLMETGNLSLEIPTPADDNWGFAYSMNWFVIHSQPSPITA